MISQLMTQLNNTTKSERYQQDKVWLHKWFFIRFCFFKKKYRLIAADLSKQKTDSRVIQQIIFTGKIKSTETNTRVINYYILELSKETILEFAKGTAKVLSVHINGWIQ